MLFNVFFDLFLSHRTHRRTEIAARPHVAPPIALLQMRKLILQQPRRPSFQVLHHFRWAQLRPTRHQDMDMVLTHMPPDDFDFSTQTTLQDQLSSSLGHFAAQDMIALLRHPHKVVLDIIDRMRSFAIVCHFRLPLIPILGRLLYLNSLLKLFA